MTRSGVWRGVRAAFYGPGLAIMILLVLLTRSAHAERLSFRNFGPTEGLGSLTGTCMTHDKAGHLLVCSEHGVYIFNGRRFVNLGPAHGLRDGGIVYDISLTEDGRIGVRYADAVFLSEPLAPEARLNGLRFHQVDLGGATIYLERGAQMAPWRDGLAVLIGRRTMAVVGTQSSRVSSISYGTGEAAMLSGPLAIFSVEGRLWETFSDGRVCAADPGFVTCYGPAQGLADGPWQDVIAGTDGTILARSATSLATIDPHSGRIREETLPAQRGRYRNYSDLLGLFRMPSGALATQSDDGLIIREKSGWVQVTTHDGLPAGLVTGAMHDDAGRMWLQVMGSGLFLDQGYGHWDTLQTADGLSDPIVWELDRPAGGALWVATDGGIDQVETAADGLEVSRVAAGPAFALRAGPDGRLWTSAGDRNARVIDPRTGATSMVAVPPVNAIAPDRGRVWFGTEQGLYSGSAGDRSVVLDGVSDRPVTEVLPDQVGGVWLLSEGRLWHRRADGRHVMVAGAWPPAGFEPLALARGCDGQLWIGGIGGLFHVVLVGDRIVSLTEVPQSDIQSGSVVAVLVDSRGWVWAGTGQGVSAFDGVRWVSATANDGLVSNDVSQRGLHEDPDGSIWIATSNGLSHLRDPSWLFAAKRLRVVIAEARLGEVELPVRRLAYSNASLSLGFGTFRYSSDPSIVFRYNLSGVDRGWVETTTGSVRYPFVPPGHHVLTVVGIDALTHAVSAPVMLTIDMAHPWWRRAWADTLFLVTLACCAHGAVRWRIRKSLLRQRMLEHLVQERTREIALAQADLQRQAALDGLTGLFNRTELQRRLAEGLGTPIVSADVIVAMLDLDHFKRINDRFGHLAGDDVLRLTGQRVSAILREAEYAGRYGGEEILVVLDDTDGQGARRILGLHHSIGQAPFYVDNTEISVTCSIGVTWAGQGDDWRSLIRRADAALYEAKTQGRNRVVERGWASIGEPFVWPGSPCAGPGAPAPGGVGGGAPPGAPRPPGGGGGPPPR